jgi:uncharacterized protein (TIGR02996 family)
MLDALARSPSPSTFEAVREAAIAAACRRMGGVARLRHRSLLASGARRPTEPLLSEEARHALDRLASRLAASAVPGLPGERLLEAVYGQPEVDGPRWVYADWLGEANDPRGEFIVLQLRRAADGSRPSRREKELERRHAGQWLGPLAPLLVKKHTSFSRGFLASCGIKEKWLKDRALVGHPLFSTVTRLDLSSCDAVWANHPTCRALRAVTGVAMWTLRDLKRQVEHLGLTGFEPSSLETLKEQKSLRSVSIDHIPAHTDWAYQTLRPLLGPAVTQVVLNGRAYPPPA